VTNPKYLSIEAVAAYLECSRRHIERQRSTGRFPRPDFTVGNRPRWRTTTIDKWAFGQNSK
jgi:predicted DNA-binding transcriptional regulator AlpA